MGYITEKLDLMSTGDDNSPTLPGSEITQEVIYDEEELAIIEAIDSAGSLNDFLYQWANNGGELYAVLPCLKGDLLDGGGYIALTHAALGLFLDDN